MQMTVSVTLDGGLVLSASSDLDRVNDDHFQEIAAGLAYGLVEDVWGVIGAEDDW